MRQGLVVSPHHALMPNNVFIPLYKREQWTRWQQLFEGTQAAMLWTYDVWLENHRKLVEKHKALGDVVRVIESDIDDYLAWTASRGLPINGYTRTDFAMRHLPDAERDKQN